MSATELCEGEVLIRVVRPANKSGDTGRVYLPKKYIGKVVRISVVSEEEENR